MLLSEESAPAAVLDELQQLQTQLQGHAEELARLNRFQRLFKVQESQVDDLSVVQEDVALKMSLWSSSAEFESVTAAWKASHFESLDLAGMEDTVARFHKSVFRMERGLPPNKLAPKLRAAVDEYRQLLPVVAVLRNKALKERHWAKVFAAIGTTLNRDETFTLQALLDANVTAVKDALITISTEATQEAALEELLAKVTSKWAAIEFSVVPYKDSKDVFILGAIDEIQVRIAVGVSMPGQLYMSKHVTWLVWQVPRDGFLWPGQLQVYQVQGCWRAVAPSLVPA
eukprot:GHUV01026655.1.p1 GENE.GHUV01026655.1~~GHUV01026655.1.p1  ORF type:complete len:285 (+),score=109.46 GHUV01026655.1:1668-2522(+)